MTFSDIDVTARLNGVRERIELACRLAGRDASDVQLVAVSKRIPVPLVVEVCAAGQRVLGENRTQDALLRRPVLAANLTKAGLSADLPIWHFIGHLQKNKVNKAVGEFSLLHGIDSVALAEKIAARAQALDITQAILLEVNITGEAQKHGLTVDEVCGAVARLAETPGIDLQGLMAMARHGADEAELHTTFTTLRRLRDEAATAANVTLPHLSMGMSGDFEIAIAEGATLVRVGSSIFGPRTA